MSCCDDDVDDDGGEGDFDSGGGDGQCDGCDKDDDEEGKHLCLATVVTQVVLTLSPWSKSSSYSTLSSSCHIISILLPWPKYDVVLSFFKMMFVVIIKVGRTNDHDAGGNL